MLMYEKKLNDLYFDWIFDFVGINEKYDKLTRYLNSKDFYYLLPMDENREADGIDLRYRFAYENHLDYRMVCHYLDNRPCSILEMMVALSLRCFQIVKDSAPSFDVYNLFNDMLESLQLSYMDDQHFNMIIADEILCAFLERKYSKNGVGGLFTLNHCLRDLTKDEIWCQAMWYLNEKLEENDVQRGS